MSLNFIPVMKMIGVFKADEDKNIKGSSADK